jgi:hypothetical protein
MGHVPGWGSPGCPGWHPGPLTGGAGDGLGLGDGDGLGLGDGDGLGLGDGDGLGLGDGDGLGLGDGDGLGLGDGDGLGLGDGVNAMDADSWLCHVRACPQTTAGRVWILTVASRNDSSGTAATHADGNRVAGLVRAFLFLRAVS